MEEYLKFAQDLARQAGQIIKDNFENNQAVEIKSDNTPVTEVDKKINKLVSDAIRQKYPDHGLMGEEEDYGTGKEELKWLCDPLDGTVAFIVGMQHSTFILALTEEGKPRLAIVYDPFTDHLYHAIKAQGAFCNDQPIQVNHHTLDGGYVLFEQSAFGLYEKLQATGAITEPVAGAGYRAMLLAQGRCSAEIQGKADFHDVGPASLIVEEAGGKVTDLKGKPLRFDRSIVERGIILSNGHCHDELLTIVRK